MQVCAVARQPPSPGLLPDCVQFVQADLSAGAGLADLVNDVDVVFHLAARLHVSNPDPSLSSAYERDNVGVTRGLAEALSGSARFVFFSTIDVYGPTSRAEVADERTPPQPRSLYGRTKLAAEGAALAHPGATVLRVAAVYGARVKGNYARLVQAVRHGRFVTVGAGRNRRTLVYDEDLAEAAWRAATDPRARGRVYNVTDGSVHTVDDIAVAIAEAVGRRPSLWHLPVAPIRLAAVMLERGCSLIGRQPPVTAAMIDKLQEDLAVSGALIQDELGFRPALTLREGWARAVKQMRGSAVRS